MTSNNVIVFPKENKNFKTSISIEEIHHNVEMMNQYHIQETIANIAPMLFNQLEVAGFYLGDDEDEDDIEHIREMAFIIESLRSFMFKHYGLYHPFHKLTEEIFEKELTDEGALKIVDKVTINFKDEEESDNR